jgi:membrane associated rhomboid family serine protease
MNLELRSNAIHPASNKVLLHWRIIYPGYDDPWEMCVSADRVFDDGEYTPLFVSSFEHASNLHLFCNMASFVWTAACLEHKLHPLYFIYMLFSFAWICNLAEIAIAEITTRYSICLPMLATRSCGN